MSTFGTTIFVLLILRQSYKRMVEWFDILFKHKLVKNERMKRNIACLYSLYMYIRGDTLFLSFSLLINILLNLRYPTFPDLTLNIDRWCWDEVHATHNFDFDPFSISMSIICWKTSFDQRMEVLKHTDFKPV